MNRLRQENRREQVGRLLDSQLESLIAFINAVRIEDPFATSDAVKQQFVEGCNKYDAQHPNEKVKGTGFADDAFELFWSIAWEKANEVN